MRFYCSVIHLQDVDMKKWFFLALRREQRLYETHLAVHTQRKFPKGELHRYLRGDYHEERKLSHIFSRHCG